MKFRFRLERALQFARLKESSKKAELASAIQRTDELQQQHVALAASQHQLLQTASRFVDLARAPYQNAKVRADMLDLQRLEQAISQEKGRTEKLKQDLGRLAMRRKALESLREKRQQDFRVSENRREQHAIDETFRVLPKKD